MKTPSHSSLAICALITGIAGCSTKGSRNFVGPNALIAVDGGPDGPVRMLPDASIDARDGSTASQSSVKSPNDNVLDASQGATSADTTAEVDGSETGKGRSDTNHSGYPTGSSGIQTRDEERATSGSATSSIPDFEPVPYEVLVTAPGTGDSLRGLVEVKGWARGFLNVEVWDDSHQNPPLARTTPSSDGAFALVVNTAELTPGSTTWTVWGWDSPAGQAFDHSDSMDLALTIGGETSEGPLTAPKDGRNYLMGFYTNGKATADYHTWLGYYPEVFYGNSYQEHVRGGSFYPPDQKYPIVFDVDICHADLDYAEVAAGIEDANLIATRDSIPDEWLPFIYAFRIDSEFNLSCEDVDPDTYRRAAEHVIDLYKSKSGMPSRVKYIWNPNVYKGSELDRYVPRNCDVIGIDAYAQPKYDVTSAYLFGDKDEPAHGSIRWWTQVAKDMGKGVALPEWGDDYGDGVFVREVAEWANDPANNVVYLGYWDSDDNEDARLRGDSFEAFQSAFSDLTYTGAMFAPLIASSEYPEGF